MEGTIGLLAVRFPLTLGSPCGAHLATRTIVAVGSDIVEHESRAW